MYSWREGTGDKATALQNLFDEIYIQDITKRNRMKNIGKGNEIRRISPLFKFVYIFPF